jgi:hypothetical protein
MKKTDVMKTFTAPVRSAIAKLQRKSLYVQENYHGYDVLMQITHFKKNIVRCKVMGYLVTGEARIRAPRKGIREYASIPYRMLPNYTFREASPKDIPLFINNCTPKLQEYLTNMNQ